MDARPTRSSLRWLAVCVPLILIGAFGKILTGGALTLSPLHVLLVVACAWYLGRAPAVVVATLCAMAYPLVHVVALGDRTVADAAANTLLQAGVYGAAVALVARFRRDYEDRSLAAAAAEAALEQVRLLRGSHVLCPRCHQVRDEREGWQDLERWITARTAAGFAHLPCPRCASHPS
jgi:hypothetical protein